MRRRPGSAASRQVHVCFAQRSLVRMAGRCSRRVRALAKAHKIPVIDCGRGDRKHQIAEEYPAAHPVSRGVFLILVARAAATVWEVKRSASGVIGDIAKKTAYINHYSFHIMDQTGAT